MASANEFGAKLPENAWQELCTHIRTTDEISFKLLGFVPAITFSAIAAAFGMDKLRFTPLLVLISLFAAAVTMALWIWERRNIQTCLWMQARAAHIEAIFGVSPSGHFLRFPAAPGTRGKRDAERIVYGSTIAAWLLLPAVALFSDKPDFCDLDTGVTFVTYALAAELLALRARELLSQEISIDPKPTASDCRECWTER
jgi:hypothetical protein